MSLYSQRFHLFVVLTLVVLLDPSQSANAWTAASDWVQSPGARVRIIAANIESNGGIDSIVAGVQLQLDKGWKTYWRTPGDAGGIPPELDWDQSDNMTVAQILYPAPHRLESSIGTSIGYSDEVVFPLQIKLKDPAKPALLRINVLFGICKDICVPVESELALKLVDQPGAEAGISAKLISNLKRVPHKIKFGADASPTVKSVSAKLTGSAPEIIIDAR